jgi:hypothetical protein
MRRRQTDVLTTAAMVVVAAILLLSTAACGGDPAPETRSPASGPSPAGSAPPAGTKLAPGLYDLADGSVQAVGTVEYRDLEGGFWVVMGGTEAEGDAGTVVAVIANGADYADQFRQHPGLSFVVDGTRLDGASTRMAGPEITVTRVTLVEDDAGPAE